ncbi:hypothetical protein [uncultured Paraglaciecola sp.]|uniref:hypothetical protein n=1 Tax=uncultured Paraglaciecola sp. TaxID=1765024 RepID=UPI0030DB45FE|tara:strand:- start:77277 stop:77885 length:609 start_codon:yes stop_codon:yes gene_type:complete
MNLKLIILFSAFILFSSCELLPVLNSPETMTKDTEASTESAELAESKEEQPICVWEVSSDENNCKIEYWLQYWYQIEDMPWPERKSQIEALSDQDVDVLKKVFLSQGKSTPYQARLRAQGWVELILPKLSQRMRRFITVALYYPSQDLLEMESALVTLSKINTHQSFNIEEQQIQLKKQQSQIDQLLNIEASIMESIEEEKE